MVVEVVGDAIAVAVAVVVADRVACMKFGILVGL